MTDYSVNYQKNRIVFKLCDDSTGQHIIEVIAPIDNDDFTDLSVSKGCIVDNFLETSIFHRFGLSNFATQGAIDYMRELHSDEQSKIRKEFENILSSIRALFDADARFSECLVEFEFRQCINEMKRSILNGTEDSNSQVVIPMSVNELLFGGE